MFCVEITMSLVFKTFFFPYEYVISVSRLMAILNKF